MADLDTADLSAALAEHAVGFSSDDLDDVTLDHLTPSEAIWASRSPRTATPEPAA